MPDQACFTVALCLNLSAELLIKQYGRFQTATCDSWQQIRQIEPNNYMLFKKLHVPCADCSIVAPCCLRSRAATDHNVDNTTAMLREWLKWAQRVYHYVEWRPMDEPR